MKEDNDNKLLSDAAPLTDDNSEKMKGGGAPSSSGEEGATNNDVRPVSSSPDDDDHNNNDNNGDGADEKSTANDDNNNDSTTIISSSIAMTNTTVDDNDERPRKKIILLKRKSEKRRHHQQHHHHSGGNKKSNVLSSFDEEEEEGGQKRKLDEFLLEGNDTNNVEGVDIATDNNVDSTKRSATTTNNNNINNDIDGGDNDNEEASSSITIQPPDRVMSPMPQVERADVPLCHSPSVSESPPPSTTTTATLSATATTGSGNSSAVSNKIRIQQQNNLGQMRILQHQQQQRQQQQASQHASQQLASRFSSSSTNNSSGDEGDVRSTTTKSIVQNNNSTARQQQQQQQQQHSQQSLQQQQHSQQPPGWRVKLYRLNMDGTWDDCGTGRIQFYYSRGSGSAIGSAPSGSGSAPSGSGSGGSSATGGGEGANNNMGTKGSGGSDGASSSSDGGGKSRPSSPKRVSPLHHQQQSNNTSINLFRELGEPMLCMRAELSQKQQGSGSNNNTDSKSSSTNNNNNDGGGSSPPSSSSSSSGEKVLLRTRVLLHEAYQCQGGNIITWCEPFHAHGKQQQQQPSSLLKEKDSSNKQQQGNDSAGSSSPGVDLALSFQDNAGCKDIWQHILNVQSRAREVTTHFANTTNNNSTASHSPLSPKPSTHGHPLHNSPNSPDHDFLEDKLIAGGGGATPLGGGIPSRPPIWNKDSNMSSSLSNTENSNRLLHSHNHAKPSSPSSSSDDDEEEQQFHDAVDHMAAVSMAAAAAASYKPPKDGYNSTEISVSSPLPLGSGGGGTPHGFHINNNNSDTNATISPLQLPKSPTWDDLQAIGDIIAGVNLQQREDFLIFLSQSDCAYIKLLLQLFPPAEEKGEDITELAGIVKTILLLNDPEIIEYVTSDAPTFELICGVLEYDPELREKANHRDFIRTRARFRTVIRMEDEELVSLIHHLFRVTFLRDNVLRPTMDESSLSTLVSLAQFTQSDIIKGVITAPKIQFAAGGENSSIGSSGVSYLTKITHLLEAEIDALRTINSDEDRSGDNAGISPQNENTSSEVGEDDVAGTMWQQHLAPQDSSASSRHIRRRGCLMFLRELFCQARVSLQQPEKDEFIESAVSNSKLLLLLGAILSDPNVSVEERGAALEIVSVVAMHDPCVIRRHVLQGAGTAAEDSSNEMFSCLRPDPNDHREVIFICPPNDFLLSILFVMATETDAGLLLQTSEIIRIILDTDILGEQNSLGGSFMNEENDINAMNSQNSRHDAGSEEQNSFLALFYDRYIQWLVVPFQYKLLISKTILPMLSESNSEETFNSINRKRQEFKHCSASDETSLTLIPSCAVRASFTLEILSFCVRAHVYRMKFFILRTRLLGTILKVLCPKASHEMESGDKCLRLASLKLLRSVLSVKDEFYHRHIVQYNLFAPVFEIFRITPVGSNLISSAVLEMCDFIRVENIKSLLEYIVTKHLSKPTSPEEESLEDIANPYVDTFAQLRRAHEENMGVHHDLNEAGHQGPNNDGTTFSGRPAPVLNKRALEDQRKFREAESEDSYFNDDDDDEEIGPMPHEQRAPLQAMSETTSLLADVASLE